MIRILMADDHPIVRQGLKQIISDCADMDVVDEASDGQEVLEKVRNGKYDVLLLDISMPVKGGLDIIKQLKVENPEMAILVISMHPEEQYATRVLKNGASGYITKDRTPEELVQAIRTVATGKKYISQSFAQELASNLIFQQNKPHDTLSDREYRVLCMIGSGMTNSEMAEKLSLSPKTVSTYRSRILKKLDLTRDVELIRYVIDNNLLE